MVSDQTLRERQGQLFERMSADPQNLDLMFTYAGLSARLRDYEAAISTLERMLIFNADLPRVRLELGALYFNIGSYSLSERYFRAVLAEKDTPPLVRERVEAFLVEITNRQRKHHFSGRLEFGAIYDSNAGLGPENRDVFLFGRRAVLTDDRGNEGDVGARAYASVSHRYDFGGPTRDFWQTDATFIARYYDDVSDGDSASIFLKSGPRLSLDDRLNGPKLRPFLGIDYVTARSDALYTGARIGADYSEVLSSDWSVFASLAAGVREHSGNRDDEDGGLISARSGFAWTGIRDLTLTAGIEGARDIAKADFEKNTEASLRLTASFDYDPGVSFAEKKWQLTSYATATYRIYDEPNAVVSAAENRRDTDLRFGLQHTFHFRDGFYGVVGTSALIRKSSIPNFELENVGVSASLGYEF